MKITVEEKFWKRVLKKCVGRSVVKETWGEMLSKKYLEVFWKSLVENCRRGAL